MSEILCKGLRYGVSHAPHKNPRSIAMPYTKPVVTPDWMRLAEAAAQLGCHPDTVRNRITAGTITGVRVLRFDGVARVHREDWHRYMDSITVQPAAVS